MTQWGEGYVSDIPYLGGVYREQMPSHLDAVCLVAGVEPVVEAEAPFNYCELGCGMGETAMTIAAAYPQANVWGFDFNPGHIAQGHVCASRAGLDNLVLAERSFEDLARSKSADMPQFDYVTLHGVWSWISLANRAHIVAFLREHLRPGGVVSISYNAMPGWSGDLALQHLFLEAARRIAGSSEIRIREAIALARRVADAGESALDPKRVAALESILANGQARYLSHEYLNDHWMPVFHADVAAALAPAKLTYVGSANILENFLQVCVKPEQNAFLSSMHEPLRQTLLDFFCPRTFRRDVFIKGVRVSSPRKRERRLGAQRLALVIPARAASCIVSVPIGKATLTEAFYGPALAALGIGNASVRELLDAAVPGAAPAPEEIVGFLIGSKQVMPICASADETALARVRRFNRARIEMAIEEGLKECWLASPIVGAAVPADIMEMLIYEVTAADPDPATIAIAAIRSGVFALMKQHGMSADRKPSEELTDTDLGREIEAFIAEKLPIWRRIGLL